MGMGYISGEVEGRRRRNYQGEIRVKGAAHSRPTAIPGRTLNNFGAKSIHRNIEDDKAARCSVGLP